MMIPSNVVDEATHFARMSPGQRLAVVHYETLGWLVLRPDQVAQKQRIVSFVYCDHRGLVTFTYGPMLERRPPRPYQLDYIAIVTILLILAVMVMAAYWPNVLVRLFR